MGVYFQVIEIQDSCQGTKLVLNIPQYSFLKPQKKCYISYNRINTYIFRQMTTAFSGPSRLANFRQKKNSAHEDPLNTQGQLKLTLPQPEEKTTTYEPTATFSNTRTSMRLLKGKIQRKQSADHYDLKSDIKSAGLVQVNSHTQQKLSLYDTKEDLKLVLHDSPQIVEKKVVEQAPSKPLAKRIMITKQVQKQQPVKEVPQVPPPPPQKQQQPIKAKKPEPPKEQPKQQKPEYKNPHDEKPIKQEEVQDSKEQPENQNDLVLCPEGCGRTFNRKALEKHAKACKLVFMSKRKEFNSQAKRLTSKEQANLVKQVKQKEKLGKTKGFEKTGENWKAASEDFRAAIKAIKKQQAQKDQQVDVDKMDGDQAGKEVALKLLACEHCQKMFAQVLLEKHLENCVKKKQKEKAAVKKGGAAIKKK